jgi:hypothetical protein
MNRNTGMSAGQIIGTMNGQLVVGLDIAKQVFQLHTVDMDTGEIVNLQIKRAIGGSFSLPRSCCAVFRCRSSRLDRSHARALQMNGSGSTL